MTQSSAIKQFQRQFFKRSDIKHRKHIATDAKRKGDLIFNKTIFHYFDKTLVNPAIVGIISPKSPEGIRAFSFTSYHTNDLKLEIKWLLGYLLSQCAKITHQLELVKSYSTCFLLGKYDNCRIILNDYKNKFGYCFWIIENEAILLEQEGGAGASNYYLDNIIQKINDQTARMIAYFLCVKAQRKTSLPVLESRINKTWGKSTDGGFFGSYLTLHVLHHKKPTRDYLSSLCCTIMGVPLFDRYRLFKRILKGMVATDFDDQIRDALDILYKESGDEDLAEVLHEIDCAFSIPKWLETHISYAETYFRGDYEKVIMEGRKKIINGTILLEDMKIFSRALFYQSRSPELLELSPSPIYDLLLAFQHQNQVGKDYLPALERVLQITSDSLITHDLSALVALERKMSTASSKDDEYINGRNFFTLSHAYSDRNSLWRQFLNNTFPIDCCIKYYFSSEYDIDFVKSKINEIPYCRIMRWEAKIHFSKGNINVGTAVCKKIIAELITNFNGPKSTVRSVLRELILASVEYHFFQPALEAIVEIYIETQILPDTEALNILLYSIDEMSSFGSEELLNYSILLSLGNANVKNTAHAYEAFLLAQQVKTPHEFMASDKYIRTSKQRLFLKHVCTKEVLAESIEFCSTDDLETERLIVCGRLKDETESNLYEIEQEIKQLTDSIAIRRGLKAVAESKVYADESGLRIARAAHYRDLILRYKDAIMFDKMGFYPLSMDQLVPNIEDKRSLKEAKLFLINVPGFEAFKEIFNTIREDFTLSNEFGLDSYLSVRIRHGVLLGQLRKPFEIHHLITKRASSDSKYIINEHWEGEFSNEENTGVIQPSLAKLSSKVDAIINEINNSWLRISTEKNPKVGSRFNFEFSDIELAQLYEDINAVIASETEILNLIFRALWKRIEENIKIIRSDLGRNTLNTLIGEINEVEAKIKGELTASRGAMNLSHALAKCRTDLQYELEKISAWFQLPKNNSEGEFYLSTPITIAVQLTKELNLKTTINSNSDIMDMISISNKYFTTFVDMFLLLLSNAVKHSGLQESSIDIKISGHVTRESMTINITNKLCDSVSVKAVHEVVNERWRQALMDNTRDAVRAEGGSGLFKLHKLLKYNLKEHVPRVTFSTPSSHEFCVTIALNPNNLK
ncbi:hypothetical protein OH491_07265 [Termitidicoccus mucosus]|uniref:hypothetical protein n=1 Tax=Termitidicoccus mucosus TaxID=1184151 RepID=UPI003184078F